ncbi:ras association domain-containing protein 9 [Nerophis ophidion]|uniref:ras association domain-containing protein 9 n=1 Tax=Nerophis ophidion TaxID=159077 RepID=UPI002ADF84F8|nr:ras association domain-containing protein 9 [Nerophis ophidion]
MHFSSYSSSSSKVPGGTTHQLFSLLLQSVFGAAAVRLVDLLLLTIMAPFGRNFLKARLKSRTKDSEVVTGKEIQVTVCKEEKVVCGVTKHTTCADIIQALLDDHRSIAESKRLLHGESKDFCLLERWKGFERALPPLTRILRLWNAWGDQRPFIQFVLVKTSDFVPTRAMKGPKTRSSSKAVRSVKNLQTLPVDKQKRVVKKVFRKLEKIHKDGKVEIQDMVQIILDQDHTIQEQIRRMRDLDFQTAQLQVQKEGEEFFEDCGSTLNPEQLDELLHASEDVHQLELQLQRHQAVIRQLSHDIDAELRMASEGEEAKASSWTYRETDQSLLADLERMQAELRRSVLAGLALCGQAAEVDKQLHQSETALLSRDQECRQLATQLGSLQICEAAEEAPVAVKMGTRAATFKQGSSLADVTDTDSDTGISSTHSQDSLSPSQNFHPPLDTDV